MISGIIHTNVRMMRLPSVSIEAVAATWRKTLAKNVKAARRDLSMTQEDLAKCAGTSQRRIAMIEGAHGNPTLLTVVRLGICLKRSALALLSPR